MMARSLVLPRAPRALRFPAVAATPGCAAVGSVQVTTDSPMVCPSSRLVWSVLQMLLRVTGPWA